MNTAITKRELIEGGVDALLEAKPLSPGVTVEHHARGGVSKVDLAQVVEVAKLMAASQDAVPPHCRGNVGICLRVTFQAVEWQMSPFSVADMSYTVSGRLAYQSQLLHAVVEGRAPLLHRLECTYAGEGTDMTCTVRGTFARGEVREYTSPKIKDIKVKNSPLWTADPQQQLFYFSSRSWARKWCPDVLLGCYTKEEIQRFPELQEQPATPGLHARLSGSAKADEGHKDGHVAAELDAIDKNKTIDHEPAPAKERQPAHKRKGKAAIADKAKGTKRASEPRSPKAGHKQKDTAPKTVAEYVAYARRWIRDEADKVSLGERWNAERRMRNDIGLTAEDRAPLEAMMKEAIGK